MKKTELGSSLLCPLTGQVVIGTNKKIHNFIGAQENTFTVRMIKCWNRLPRKVVKVSIFGVT